MAMEVVTTVDKGQRDRLFEDLRKNGNELERQVVKFSGVEPVINPETGLQLQGQNHYGLNGKIGKIQFRPIWISNWSVAYPTS